MAIRIGNGTISDRPWGEVDKAALVLGLAEDGWAQVRLGRRPLASADSPALRC
ncbi:MAG: hypothetical protein JSV79_01585 [Armatimonadota bacterium]|nr:MAG: hypothetical protein JSV79_01585 [Armatimonadota bacterium]